jgi:hypothetical protein
LIHGRALRERRPAGAPDAGDRMLQLLVNKVATLGDEFSPLAPDHEQIHDLLDQTGAVGISSMRNYFGPERLEPRASHLPALRYWTFALPAPGSRQPASLLRVTFAEDARGAGWEYQGDERTALLVAGLVAARMMRR